MVVACFLSISTPPTQILLTFQEFVFRNLHHLSGGIRTVTLMAASHQICPDKEESVARVEKIRITIFIHIQQAR